MEVLNELIEQYKSLSVDLQRAIALLLLPLDNPKENALIVNALQRSSRIVVQNSIQEGFGLTATEAILAYSFTRSLAEAMPAYRAASGFSPITRTSYPNLVR